MRGQSQEGLLMQKFEGEFGGVLDRITVEVVAARCVA
jgi:hypothetical protein